VLADLAVYTDGHRCPGELALHDAFAAGRGPESFVWLGLVEPRPHELEAVTAEFGLHELAVQDAVHAHQRPKLEVYGDSLFVVLKTARYDDAAERVEFAEIQLFIGDGFVVTVRHGPASALADVRRHLEADPEMMACGPAAVLHAVMDRVVDDYLPVVNGIDNDLHEVEIDVFTPERTNPAERIFALKRQVLDFHRNTQPLLDALHLLETAKLPHVPSDLAPYYRDVRDHLLRVVTRIESIRDLLTDALSANLANVTVRQNEDMRAISAWVAIAAIPTMIAGIYGMNFEHMPELDQPWSYPAVLTTMALLCGLAYRWFRRADWI
jgi:magnesium transporter